MARLDYAGARQIYEDALIRARDEGRLFPDASMFQVDLFAHELLLGRLDAFRRGLREWLEERGRDWQWYDWQNAQWAAPVYFLLPTDENRIRLGEKMQGYMEAKPVQSRRILWVARLLAYAGRPEDARLHLETWIADDSLRLRTAQGPIREARGHILVEEGKIEEGLALFREKTDSLGCGRNCWGELGWLYDHHGYDGETFEAYRAYLRAPPSLNGSDIVYLPRIHERLGQLYEERGDLNRAEHHHEQFVRLWEDADPIFQPRVQAAREALARVRAQLKDRISHRTPGTEIVHG
jgi:tetratricopeptide (TPR) repeat protein